MQTLFKTTDDVQKTVKINASFPFESLAPYLDDAYERYILPYVGETLIKKLSTDPECREIVLMKKALGPLALAMASPELGISIGATGHTVVRTDKVTVASDIKIQQSEESMEERGWRNLELLLELLSSDLENYSEWKESAYYKHQSKGHYFNSARQFQDLGMVDIHYSRITFEKLRPVMERYELILRNRLSPTLQEKLLTEAENSANKLLAELLRYVRLWLASTVAGVFSSQTTRSQRSKPGTPEFKPVFYPLYHDIVETGNFYAEQAAYWDGMITDYMAENASDLGLLTGTPVNFNSIDRHIFAT